MTAASAPTAQDALRIMRQLAEEGRSRPLLSGRHLLLFGAAIALASLLHGAVLAGIFAWPPVALPIIWLGLITPAVIASRVWRPAPGDCPQTIGNKVEQAVWQAGGAFLGGVSLSTLALAYLRREQSGETMTFFLMSMIAPITFGVYAPALAASAAAGRVPALKAYAALAMVFVVASALTAGTAIQFVVMAAGAVVVSVLPGLMLLKRERVARG